VVTVSFVDGNVVSADSQHKKLEDLLGSVLVKSGRVSERQLQEALKTQKRTLQRLGNILIEAKYISHEDLSEALRLQVTQVVYRLFRWKDGDYLFKQDESIEYDREHFTPLTAESILMEGIRMIDEWPIIEKKIRSVDLVFAKTKPKAGVEIRREEDEEEDALGAALTGAAPAGPGSNAPPGETVVVSETEARVYECTDGILSVQELIDRSGLGDFETCRTLYDLLARGLIREIMPGSTRRAAPALVRSTFSPLLWRALTAVVVLAAAVSFATMGFNPLNRIPPAHPDPLLDKVLTAITRSHVKRVDEAIQVYYLQKGFYPDDLAELINGRLVTRGALKDAWGRGLGYLPDEGGYRIVVYAEGGRERADLSVERHNRGGSRPSGAAQVPAAGAGE